MQFLSLKQYLSLKQLKNKKRNEGYVVFSSSYKILKKILSRFAFLLPYMESLIVLNSSSLTTF